MEHRVLSYKNSKVSYYCFGSGSKQVVCFHGYGEEATLYAFLEKYADNQFTFYAIDLPFHGQTNWNDGLNFSHTDLQQIVRAILAQANEQRLTRNGKLTLMGFSLGGRIALSLYQSQPETVEKIILLAPDGLIVNFWYWLSTQTWAGNKLFAFSMKYHGCFFCIFKNAK